MASVKIKTGTNRNQTTNKKSTKELEKVLVN